MSATPANAARNMATLRGNVIARLGLSTDDNAWTQSERVSYLREMAREVVRLAASLTPEQVAQAQLVLAKQYDTLADTSLDWGTFASDVAGDFGSTVKLLLAAAVIGVVVFALVKSNPAPVSA